MRFWDSSEVRMPDRDEKPPAKKKPWRIVAALLVIAFIFRSSWGDLKSWIARLFGQSGVPRP